MDLRNILNELKDITDGGVTKTASQTAPQPVDSSGARDKLIGALNDAMQPATKVASQNDQSATDQLVKMAADLANSDAEAIMKEANLYGAAVADGFMARLQGYEQATQGMEPVKTASMNGEPTEAEYEKFAAENPDLTKQAVELGYLHGKQQIEVLQKQAFDQGYTDGHAAIEELSKTAEGRQQLATIASDLTKEAAAAEENELSQALEKLGETKEGQEKLAAIRQGYADGMAGIEKTANDCFARGYNDTISILRALNV